MNHTMSEIKMLDHQKIILRNVNQDPKLFRKELLKSLNWLSEEDQQKLYDWVKTNYWSSHKNIIQEVFEKVAA